MITVCGEFLHWGKPQVTIVFDMFYMILNWHNDLDDLEAPGLGLAQDNLWSSVSWRFGARGAPLWGVNFCVEELRKVLHAEDDIQKVSHI